ncbi:hypothetical protein YQE_01315, partial [Dendroctonus ponderosae]
MYRSAVALFAVAIQDWFRTDTEPNYGAGSIQDLFRSDPGFFRSANAFRTTVNPAHEQLLVAVTSVCERQSPRMEPVPFSRLDAASN